MAPIAIISFSILIGVLLGSGAALLAGGPSGGSHIEYHPGVIVTKQVVQEVDPHSLPPIVVHPASCSIQVAKLREFTLPASPSSWVFVDRRDRLVFQANRKLIRYTPESGQHQETTVPPGWKLLAVGGSDNLYFQDQGEANLFEANWSEPQLIASWTKPVPKVFAVTVDDADLAYIWPLNQSGIEVYSRSGSHVGKIPTFDAAMDHNLSADPRYGLLLADSSMHSLTAVDRKGFEREVMPEGRVDPTEPSKMLSYPFAVQEDADKLVWVSNDWGMDKRPDMAVIDLGARRFARVAWGDHLKELEIENTDDLATFLISPTKHVLFACLNGRATMGEYEYRVKWK